MLKMSAQRDFLAALLAEHCLAVEEVEMEVIQDNARSRLHKTATLTHQGTRDRPTISPSSSSCRNSRRRTLTRWGNCDQSCDTGAVEPTKQKGLQAPRRRLSNESDHDETPMMLRTLGKIESPTKAEAPVFSHNTKESAAGAVAA